MESTPDQSLTSRLSSLLGAVSAIADSTPQLSERRSSILTVLAEATGADAGFWSWGRGTPTADTVLPIAIVDFGMNDDQRMGLMAFGTSEEMRDVFQVRVNLRRGELSQITTLRQQLCSDDEWTSPGFLKDNMQRCGWNEWLHTIRYSVQETWSALLLLRNTGSGPFHELDRQVADVAMNSITWLHSTSEESLPNDVLVGLTPRQRTVMFLVLDGLPRKTIAHQLGLSEDTIGDHIKAIYTHFRVRSAVELAAIFLRSK